MREARDEKREMREEGYMREEKREDRESIRDRRKEKLEERRGAR